MSEAISRDLDAIKEGLETLKIRANELATQSGYTESTHNDTTFQSINGQTSVSVGKAVSEVSVLDTLANKSIRNWQQVTDNLINFVQTDKDTIEAADKAQG